MGAGHMVLALSLAFSLGVHPAEARRGKHADHKAGRAHRLAHKVSRAAPVEPARMLVGVDRGRVAPSVVVAPAAAWVVAAPAVWAPIATLIGTDAMVVAPVQAVATPAIPVAQVVAAPALVAPVAAGPVFTAGVVAAVAAPVIAAPVAAPVVACPIMAAVQPVASVAAAPVMLSQHVTALAPVVFR